MMKNVIALFLLTIALFTAFFIVDGDSTPHTVFIILIAAEVFFILVYTMAKLKTLECTEKKYQLEHKKRLELEQELLKEIDLSNSIIRHKTNLISSSGHFFDKVSGSHT